IAAFAGRSGWMQDRRRLEGVAPVPETGQVLPMSKHDEPYEDTLVRLQTALVDTQIWAMDKGLRLAVVLEGGDAAGKDGTIARIVEHLSARNTRIVALPKPSDREEGQWWLQRYVNRLPTTG